MRRPTRIVTEAQQQFTFSRRAFFLGGAQMAVGGVLAARMAWISIAENKKYSLASDSNRINFTILPPRRGWIVDRVGKPIAINRTSFRVDIIPDRLTDPDRVLTQLQQIMRLTPNDMVRLRADIDKAAGFQPVPVAENIDGETFAAVSIRVPDLPGVAPAQSFARFYPDGAAVGHLVGYVGSASAKDYEKTRDPLLITPGFKVGKSGLEDTMEARLRGQPGARRSEVTARGKLVRDLATKSDTPGGTLKLTIDAGLQQFAARRLGNESGAVVVIDVETGGILTLASMPSFDPNSFSDGIGRSEWKMLQSDDHIPLLNKSMQGLYPPGSTVKPAAAIALLHYGVDPEETVYCNGGFKLGNRVFKCLGHHGSMNMRHAIMKSCNTYFYSMGRRIGYDRIAPFAKMLGLGQEFDLPVKSQRYGTIPDSAWKMRKLKKEWSQSDTLNATIGQGYVSVSPLQLAMMAARIASGRMLQPSLVLGMQKPAPKLNIPEEHLQVVRDGMTLVVNGAGTAVRSRLPLDGIQMAGKTGTAQVRRIEGSQRGQSGTWKYRDHGLFVSFVPADKPRYAAAVVIEHGLGGARAAAPVAKDFYTYLYDPAKANAALEALESGWGGGIKQRMDKQSAVWNANAATAAPAEAKKGSVDDAEVAKTEAEKKVAEPVAVIQEGQPAASVQPSAPLPANGVAPVEND
jgi:penicillin-binding protein 2